MAAIDIDTIGIPPATWISDELMRNSMPIAIIEPCIADFSKGNMLAFTLTNAWHKYKDEVMKATGGGTPPGENALKVAYVADNFPTDSFSNNYSESFLDAMGKSASENMLALNQMLGTSTVAGMAGKLAKMVPGGETAFEWGKELGGGIMDLAGEVSPRGERMVREAGTIAGKVMAGQRVDFPLVWSGSQFSPSYTLTVRLYNPSPANEEATKNYIVTPLASLLALGLPQTQDGAIYKWPFICRIHSPGIFKLEAGYISNISVVKGGDQQQIAWNQRLGIVDVRLDFASLYNTILMGGGEGDRPSLKSYLNNLIDIKPATHFTSNWRNNRLAQSQSAQVDLLTDEAIEEARAATINARSVSQAPRPGGTALDSRVSAEDREVWSRIAGSNVRFY